MSPGSLHAIVIQSAMAIFDRVFRSSPIWYNIWTLLTIDQDLKDFARNSGQLDVVYSETGRERDGKG